MTFAYADPPYIGQARRHYDCVEIDHQDLLVTLFSEYPDGWALSCSSPSLSELLRICSRVVGGVPDLAPEVRIASWCKSFCAFKRGVRPAYAWEPVIYWRGRNPGNGHRAEIPDKGGKQLTPKDFHVAPITLKKGLVGAKPASFCLWVLDLLNVQNGDTVVDLYPGTGAMSKAALERTGQHPHPQRS